MIPALEGFSAAVLGAVAEDPETLHSVANELASVAELVETNSVLLAGLTDTSVPAPARRAVLDDLLENRVSATARRLAAYAAGAAGATKVPIALAWLADHASLLAGGEVPEVRSLSFRASRERLGGFAFAVFEDSSSEDLEEIEDELFRFTRVVESTPSLRAALANPILPLEARQGVAHDLLEGKVRPSTLRLVDYVLAVGRTRDLIGALDWLVEETVRARGWRVARVRAAREVDPEMQERLSASLGALVGRPVELQVVLDGDLLSGAIVDIGDLRVDATARGRLNEMRERLVSAEWQETGFSRAPESRTVTQQEGDN